MAATERRHYPAGLVLSGSARPCGVCGAVAKLTRAHVPPQAAGNTDKVERSTMMSGDGGYQPGRWEIGGMWVRGLCVSCNNTAGAKYDLAYADFANHLLQWFNARSFLAVPTAQSVTLAPGRVTRSVLYGLLAASPHTRVILPGLAEQLNVGGPVCLPGGFSLWVAAFLGHYAQLTGPMVSGVLDGTGRAINTFAAVTFRPLTWALATSDSEALLRERGWIDASEWLRYEDDREAHDLRWLAPHGLRSMPTALHAPTDVGFQLFSSEIAPILAGRIPV